jgi:hypothetical protein
MSDTPDQTPVNGPQGQSPRGDGAGTRTAASQGQGPPQAQGGQQSQEAHQYVPRQSSGYEAPAAGRPRGMVMGFTILAAVMMMLSGIWNFLEGLAAIIKGSFFIVLPNYTYNLSVTGWGWIHLILGAVVFAAGAALLTDKLWARITGVVLVSVSAIFNFLYIPYAPVWSIALIAIDAFVIWALLTPRRETV